MHRTQYKISRYDNIPLLEIIMQKKMHEVIIVNYQSLNSKLILLFL